MQSILEAFEAPSVSIAQTNDEAIIMLDRNKIHCIFVDNMLHEQNGLILAQYIRQSQNTRIQAIPIILCTAVTGFQSIIKARDSGITEILAKPVSPEQIMEKLSRALYNPRDFIVSDRYHGPDRRRRISPIDETAEKRQSQKNNASSGHKTEPRGKQHDA